MHESQSNVVFVLYFIVLQCIIFSKITQSVIFPQASQKVERMTNSHLPSEKVIPETCTNAQHRTCSKQSMENSTQGGEIAIGKINCDQIILFYFALANSSAVRRRIQMLRLLSSNLSAVAGFAGACGFLCFRNFFAFNFFLFFF